MPVPVKRKVEEETTAILREAAKAGSAQAVRQARERGLVLTVVEDGHIVEIAPDGSRRILKAMASPRPSPPPGTILDFR
jgi:hypothetical protein